VGACLKLLVIGAKGSIGKRRMTLLEEMGHEVTGIDVETIISAKLVKEYEAAFICTPPNTQVRLAYICAENGVPIFVEKPGATNYREFLSLVGVCQKKSVVNMVACNLRFTSEFKAIQDSLPNIGKPIYATAEFGFHLPSWRDGNYKNYYSCFRMAGGGILLDAIHELDYLFALFGMPDPKTVIATAAKIEHTGELDIESEDSATLFFIYKNGPSATVHLDYLQRSYKRAFSAVGTKGRIDQVFNVQGSNAMYKAEMKHFLDCVKSGKETVKDVYQHSLILEFVDKVKGDEPETQDEQ
jgi:predicted dehydrogenase